MSKSTKKTAPNGILWLLPLADFASVSVLLFVYLGQYAALVRTQYQIVALKDQQHKLDQERSDLLLQVQELTSLERVEGVATGRLGMTPPARRQVLNLDHYEKSRSESVAL